jgi:hypothetical protein
MSRPELHPDERLARLEARLDCVEATLERAEQLYLAFMGGAGRKVLRMLGVSLPEDPQ